MATTKPHTIHSGVLRTARLHFLYVLALVIQIIIYDAAHLVTPTVILRRWIATLMLLSVVTYVWYKARTHAEHYKSLLFTLLVADIGIASFNVYVQRGMASRAVMLFAIPILVSAVLAKRTVIMTTAVACIIAYTGTAISYFVLNFNEGYKVELYGETGFYSAIFLILALLLWSLIKPKR